MTRYYIDYDSGMMSVMDKKKHHPNRIVSWWCGEWNEGPSCEHCGRSDPGEWEFDDEDIEAAISLCETLNHQEATQ